MAGELLRGVFLVGAQGVADGDDDVVADAAGVDAGQRRLAIDQQAAARHVGGVLVASIELVDCVTLRHGRGRQKLHVELTVARAVELHEIDRLGMADLQLAVLDDQAERYPDQGGLDVAGRILRRIVLVLEVDPRRHQPRQLVGDVLQSQRIGKRQHRESGGGVRDGGDQNA